jgi:hypothetical protein
MNNDVSTGYARLEVLLLVVAFVWLLLSVYPEPQLDNDLSRFASVESLVERGTWVIDDSPFHMKKPRGKRPAVPIVDMVKMGDHYYSTKPPVMSFLMAGEYWAFRHLGGLRFSEESHRPYLIWTLTFTFVALPYLGIGLLFRKVSRWFIEDPMVRVAGLFILLFCGEQWGFARTLNNHVPSAFLMFYPMVMAMGIVHGKLAPKPWVFLTIGLTAGLLPTFDLPGMFFCIPLFLYLLYWFPRQTLSWFILGAVPPLALHFALTYAQTGGFKPIYLIRKFYSYPGSYWDRVQGIDALKEPRSVYLYHMTVGRKGLFSLFPLLLLPFRLFCKTWLQCERRDIRDLFVIMSDAGILVLIWGAFTAFGATAESSRVSYLTPFLFFVSVLVPALIVIPRYRLKGLLSVHPRTEIISRIPFSIEVIGICLLSILWLIFYTFQDQQNYGGMAYGFRWFIFFTPSLAFFAVLALDRMKTGWRWGLMCFLIAISFYSAWECSLDPWTMNTEWTTRFLGKWTFE